MEIKSQMQSHRCRVVVMEESFFLSLLDGSSTDLDPLAKRKLFRSHRYYLMTSKQ